MTTFCLYGKRENDEVIERISETEDHVVALDIGETDLDPVVMEAIVDLIRRKPISKARFRDCVVHESERYLCDSAIRLAGALGGVEKVLLSGSTFITQNHLQTLLASATNLLHLQIQDHLDHRQLDALSKGLAANKTIHTLDLSGSRIHSVSLLAEGLRGNTSIRVLKMRSLKPYVGDFEEILSALHTQVETLDLSFNHCRSTDHFEDFLKRTSLQHLFLDSQNLGRDARLDVGRLTSGLISNRSLLSLSLARNNLNDLDALLLCLDVASNTTLESLDVRENQIGDIGIDSLAKAAARSPSLKRLCVLGTLCGDRGSQALFKAASENHNLSHVCVNENEFLGKEIRYMAALNRSGRKRLSEADIPLGLWPLVLERVNRVDYDDDSVTKTSWNLPPVTPQQPNVLYSILRLPPLFDSMLQAT